MDGSAVAIVAASIAAVASLASLAANIYFTRRTTREAQFRDLMKPNVVALGEELHQVVACCQVLAKKAAAGQNTKAWFQKAHDACGRLKLLHRRMKYSLGEVGEGIRELTRLANWVDHNKANAERRDALVDAADRLRIAIDDAVREAYLTGTAPPKHAIRSVRRASDDLRALWDGTPEEEAEPLHPLLAEGGATGTVLPIDAATAAEQPADAGGKE